MLLRVYQTKYINKVVRNQWILIHDGQNHLDIVVIINIKKFFYNYIFKN